MNLIPPTATSFSSTMSAKVNLTTPSSPDNMSDCGSKEQDRFLPIANVGRIMKKSLPSNAKISKEAKETVQECVSEFISFVTGEASDKCLREKRKTINGDDLLWAMTTLGFENYVGPLKVYLGKYRETEEEDSLPKSSSVPNKPSNPLTFTANVDFQNSNGRDISYGDNLNNIAFKVNNGDANGSRAMAAHLHHGSDW